MSKLKRSLLFSLFYVLFLFLVLEAALRIQQSFGPLYDLSFLKLMANNPVSQTLNHVPTDKTLYNDDGIQIAPQNSIQFPADKSPVKILFMGDSFMQGYPPQATIPEFFRKSFAALAPEEKIILWNAGYSSYAPLIYTVQAKKLVSAYQPDFIVLTLDESDLIDDYALYKPWILKNSLGETVAVKPSAPNQLKFNGYQNLSKIPFYSIRLIAMWLFKAQLYFVFEDYRKTYKGKYYEHPLSDIDRRHSFNLAHNFDESPLSQKKYLPEAESFGQDLDELFLTLAKLMKDPKKVLIVYHPHIHHLTPDARGFLWKQWVPEIAKKKSEKHGVLFYDSTEDFRKKISGNPESIYVKNDMHFNEEGLRLYADLISEKFSSGILKKSE